MAENFQSDVEAMQRIPVVPSILEIICRTTGMGFAAVARVTDTHWVACSVHDRIAFGLEPGGELPLETTICNEVRDSQKVVVIDDVSKSEEFRGHHTPRLYGFQSYISVPIIRRDGSFFGTLCAIDPKPARLDNPETIGMFLLYCDLIAFHLDALEKIEASEKNLAEEKQIGAFRDQFIAILGHDLRNPLGAVSNSIALLERLELDERAARLVDIMKKSGYRMKELIDNVLDFARGQLGEGITLNRDHEGSVRTSLDQVVGELQSVWPDREIITSYDLRNEIRCDRNRMEQVMSNLIGNALTHGDQQSPVRIEARSNESGLYFSVSNAGAKIPEAALARMFKPFSRIEVNPSQQGLGLGLYISSEIVKAHGGTIGVSSDENETRFDVHIPVNPACEIS